MTNVRQAYLNVANFFEANPDAFTTQTEARNKYGAVVQPTSPDAVCWCATGRLVKELGTVNLSKFDIPVGKIIKTNDHVGREDVIELLRSLAGDLDITEVTPGEYKFAIPNQSAYYRVINGRAYFHVAACGTEITQRAATYLTVRLIFAGGGTVKPSERKSYRNGYSGGTLGAEYASLKDAKAAAISIADVAFYLCLTFTGTNPIPTAEVIPA